ncbi:MAG TPA: DUF1501 domain-containing protein [Pirellulales bacterium]|nr:DUF1501 domain-containing protein [Pirellulales bacterium]
MIEHPSLTRRDFLRAGLVAGLAAPSLAAASRRLEPKADAVIFVWLPGGVAQADTWDVKSFTPFEKGMKGSDLLGTCESIPTTLDGLEIGAGLEQMATVMHHGTVLRSLTNETKFGAVHLKAQYYMMTGYLFPVGVKAPSMGAAVARTLGPRHQQVPPYIYLGRDIDTSDTEKQFINEYIGPGFYGPKYAPLMIPDPVRGLSTLNAVAGMTADRLDRRLKMLEQVQSLADDNLRRSARVEDYLRAIGQAREMMDSPVKEALDYTKHERAATIAAYEPQITAEQVKDKKYYFGRRFGHGLLVARRLVEAGARFVQVEYQYGAFKGFDTHEDGSTRMIELKKQVDGPLAQLIRDLDARGLLDRTLVVVATEFGRTIANQPKAGVEPIGFAEQQSGDDLVIESEKMYGFHGHFSSANTLLFFGGGFKRGLVYGRTADRHPMTPIENAVSLTDVHATIYRTLGIPADTAYVTEGRPFHVTKDGKGKAIEGLLA